MADNGQALTVIRSEEMGCLASPLKPTLCSSHNIRFAVEAHAQLLLTDPDLHDGIGTQIFSIDHLGRHARGIRRQQMNIFRTYAQPMSLGGMRRHITAWLPLDHGPVGSRSELYQVHCRTADKTRNERGCRTIIELSRCTILHDASFLHQDDPVSHAHRLDLIMSDINHRHAEPLL